MAKSDKKSKERGTERAGDGKGDGARVSRRWLAVLRGGDPR